MNVPSGVRQPGGPEKVTSPRVAKNTKFFGAKSSNQWIETLATFNRDSNMFNKQHMGLPGGIVEKNPPANAGDVGDASSIPGLGRSPGGGNGNPLSILAWKIPWIEELGRLQSMGSHRVEHD